MSDNLLLDEIHIEVCVPRSLPPGELATIRRTLQARGFLPRLRRALAPVFTAHPSLAAVRIRFSR